MQKLILNINQGCVQNKGSIRYAVLFIDNSIADFYSDSEDDTTNQKSTDNEYLLDHIPYLNSLIDINCKVSILGSNY